MEENGGRIDKTTRFSKLTALRETSKIRDISFNSKTFSVFGLKITSQNILAVKEAPESERSQRQSRGLLTVSQLVHPDCTCSIYPTFKVCFDDSLHNSPRLGLWKNAVCSADVLEILLEIINPTKPTRYPNLFSSSLGVH